MRCDQVIATTTLLCLAIGLSSIELAAGIGSKSDRFQWKHHDNLELNQVLQQVAERCAPIARLYELSDRSLNGWPLTVLELSGQPGTHETRKHYEEEEE